MWDCGGKVLGRRGWVAGRWGALSAWGSALGSALGLTSWFGLGFW